MFFNIGGGEVLVIALVALIAVGPEQLPSVLRKIGRFVAQARTVTGNLRDEFMSGLDEVNDVVNPEKWTGSGTDDDPVVPRGYAQRQATTESGEQKPAVNEIAAANARRAEPTAPDDAVPESAASADAASDHDDHDATDPGTDGDSALDAAAPTSSAEGNGSGPEPVDRESGEQSR